MVLRDPIKYAERRAGWGRRIRANIKKDILDFLGNKCVRCGFDDKRALQIDHVFGDGYKERKELGRSSIITRKFLNRIKSMPERYQLLCANCNWIKKHEDGEVGTAPMLGKESKLYKLAVSLYGQNAT